MESKQSKLGFLVDCQSVAVGNHRYKPKKKIRIASRCLCLEGVPTLEEDKKNTAKLEIGENDITEVSYHFSENLAVIFLDTSAEFEQRARDLLKVPEWKMPDPNDPESHPTINERLKGVILLLKLGEIGNIEKSVKAMFKTKAKQITYKEANDTLICTCVEMAVVENGNNQKAVITIRGYGNITISITHDFSCLAEDQFLNDVIIDSYLKYLYYEVFSEEDRRRTLIFDTFFYECLAHQKHSKKTSIQQTAQWRRYHDVEKWTKNVNIFEKDFLIIPINARNHWYLAIVCFPGMVTDVPIKTVPPQLADEISEPHVEDKKVSTEEVDKQMELEMNGEEMIVDLDPQMLKPDNEEPDSSIAEKSMDLVFNNVETVKDPCILIFDSLAGSKRPTVACNLRDYLTCEHKFKLNRDKLFTKDTMPACYPKVPKQPNYTDCGLYLLQYVESFF